jgi:hypothetical protein
VRVPLKQQLFTDAAKSLKQSLLYPVG